MIPSREQSLNLTLSLLLHALVLAVAMGWPLWGGGPVRPFPVTYTVDLVTLPPPAAPEVAAAPTARPTPSPAPPAPSTKPAAPAPRPAPPPEEDLTLPGRSRVRRESPRPTAPPPPAPARPAPPAPVVAAAQPVAPAPAAVPAASAATAAAAESDVEATAGSDDPTAATYTALVSERVRDRWQPPGRGRVVVNARILRSRFVRDVQVTQPSGNPLFDMSAVRAIQEAVPFPPFLPLMWEESVDIAFVFTGKEGPR